MKEWKEYLDGNRKDLLQKPKDVPANPAGVYKDKGWINWGAGTRAAQALVLGGKALALWQGRTHVTAEDIRKLAPPVFRHRILLNYRAEAEGITIEDVISKLIEAVPETKLKEA